MRMCHFWGQNSPICPEQIFFCTNHYYNFHLPIGPFIVQNLKKKITVNPELQGCTIFGPEMIHLPQTNFFYENY